jgi:hypothetical protein
MQQMPQKDRGLSSSRQSFYYPPTKPRQAHYPTTIQVRRRGQWDIGEAFIKCVQGINIDKRYGFLLTILLLFFCLRAVIGGSNASLSAQASTNRPSSRASHVVQIVRPRWKDLSPTALPASKTGAMHASTATSRSPSALVSQPFVTFTAAYAINHVQGVVSVHTLPGAALTINITYCDGQHATSPLLRGISYADSRGNYVWTWKPKASCTGLAAARVTASIHGQAMNQSYMFRLGVAHHDGLLMVYHRG